jgi:hypothetical protein
LLLALLLLKAFFSLEFLPHQIPFSTSMAASHLGMVSPSTLDESEIPKLVDDHLLPPPASSSNGDPSNGDRLRMKTSPL